MDTIKATATEEFWLRVEITASCWLWTGGRSMGYGRLYRGGRYIFAHRLAYEIFTGDIPVGA